MKKRKWKIWSLLLMLGLLTAGCGSASKDSVSAATTEDAYDTSRIYSMEMTEEMAVAEEVAVAEEGEYESEAAGNGGIEIQDTQRKLIRNVNLEVETETFDELLSTVEEKTQSLGGYIEESYTYNGSNYYGRDTRNANLTIRIPAEKLSEFLSDVSEISNVISRNESVTDVTLQYVDMDSHKKALQAEHDRLLELLEKAETIEDIISLESRLSEVRYQIESMESQLRTIDNQVSYSTVYLYINEVGKLTPVKEQSAWEKISTGFINSLYHVGNGLADFAIGFIIALPYLIVWAIVIVIIMLLIRWIIRRARKKRMAPKGKESEQQQESPQQQAEEKQESNKEQNIQQ